MLKKSTGLHEEGRKEPYQNQMTQTAAAAAAAKREHNRAVAALNSLRMESVIEMLTKILNSSQTLDFADFCTQCLSLSRGVDYAVANDELPDTAHKIPAVMKQLFQRNNTSSILALTMVVFISVKNACKVGWFSEEERQEILTLSKEIENKFCSHRDVNTVLNPHSIIATVMERFYPCIKIGHILTTLDIKSGYGAYTNDFHILKKTACALEETIRLIIVQVDNLDTSACIISPQQVNFIINGKGVEKRTYVLMDSGPQNPTNVTSLLKYGTNLLQAVGEFKGNYLVVVAFMSDIPLPDPPVLLDHVQSLVDGSESDPDLIEGPSRISLNCPISRSRIKLPVKGHSCKHLQCFDFNNFVNINLRRPSWRCPHCNQSAFYTEIRVDQNIAKVLKEVGDDVNNVIISADGSWKAFFENDDNDQACDINLTSLPETSRLQELTDTPNVVPSVVDLTHDDGKEENNNVAMDIDNNAFEIEDTKPSVADLLAPLDSNDMIGVDQNVAAPIDDEFFFGLNVPSGLGPSAWSEQSPSVVAPVLNSEPSDLVNPHPSPTNFPLTASPLQFINPINSNEYGSVPSITRSAVNRVPIAIQALPAQTLGAQRTRPILNSSTPSPSPSIVVSQAGLLPTPTVNGFSTICSDLERQQRFARALINELQTTDTVVSSPTSSQHHRLVTPTQNQFSSQATNPYRTGSLAGFQNAHLQQAFNRRAPQQFGQPPLLRTPVPQIGRHHPVGPVQTQPPRLVLNLAPNSVGANPVGPMQASADSTPEENWRPAGRMRGSLSGRDYSHLVDQMIQPTQQSQPPRPLPPNQVTSSPMTTMTHFHALLANHTTAHTPQPRNDAAQ